MKSRKQGFNPKNNIGAELQRRHIKLLELAKKGNDKPLLEFYEELIRKNPKDEATWINWVSYLIGSAKYEEALKVANQGLSNCPNSYGLLCNLSQLYTRLKRYKEAIDYGKRAVEINPNHWVGWLNLSAAYHYNRQPKDAERAARKCLEIYPNYDKPLTNLGNALKDQVRMEEALQAYTEAHRANPEREIHIDNLLLCLLYYEKATTKDIVSWAKKYATLVEGRAKPLSVEVKPYEGRRIKIGFVSPDVIDHSVMYFLEPLLARLDRRRFEVWVVATAAGRDSVTLRAERLVDGWLSVAGLEPERQAQIVLKEGFDVLVDCAGHTGENGLSMMAWQPAPVQITWLGYPATTGLTRIKWRITDTVADREPEELASKGIAAAHGELSLREQYSENLLMLPTVFAVYRPCIRRPLQRYHWDYAPKPTPALKNGFITFGCCNNLSKISDRALSTWARILERVPKSILLIEGQGLDDSDIYEFTKRRAEKAGIPPERLKLVLRDPKNQYIMYHNIDIALDPFPLTGGTTSFDVLWFGLPLVSLEGANFRSRLSATLLEHLGRQEWLAKNEDEYVDIAVRLASDIRELDNLRRRMRDEVEKSVLIDERRFVAQFGEAVLKAIELTKRGVSEFVVKVDPVEPDMDADTVALSQGVRITKEEAYRRLEELLEKARKVEVKKGVLHPEWKPVVEFATLMLDSLPNDIKALLALAECEDVHGGERMAVGYLRAAWREAMRSALPRQERQRILKWLFDDLEKLNQIDEIRWLAELAVEEDPYDSVGWRYLARAKATFGDWNSSIDFLIRAIQAEPELEENYKLLVLVSDRTRQWHRALPFSYERVRRFPKSVSAWADHSALLYITGNLKESEEAARRALELDPNYAHAWNALGQAQRELLDVSEAKRSFLRAAELDPKMFAAMTNALLTAQSDTSTTVEEIVELSKRTAKAYGITPQTVFPSNPDPLRKIKVGFLSADICNHSVMYFLEPLLAKLDRDSFTLVGLYARAPGTTDFVTDRARRFFDEWHWVGGDVIYPLTANKLREVGVDILIELSGHTGYNMLPVVAYRVAPAQVTWLGYPGTTGLDTVKWRITDPVADMDPQELAKRGLPEERLRGIPPLKEQYTEKLVFLPFFCTYRPYIVDPLRWLNPLYFIRPTPALKNGYITFGSCNNLAKLNRGVLRLWARVLEAVPQSKLLIEGKGLHDNKFRDMFVDKIKEAGIDPERVILLPRDTRNQYLTYHQIDIALDPFPLTGGTTTFDALWMGVPVVTLEGGSFRGRMTTSILTALGAVNWIAKTEEDYVRIASALAGNLEKLNQLRLSLRARMLQSPLMDEVGFARRFEMALREIWFRVCAKAKAGENQEEQMRLIEQWRKEWQKILESRGAPPLYVYLEPGKRIPLEEALKELKRLWEEAEAIDRSQGRRDGEPGPKTSLREHWKRVFEYAVKVLESQPKESAQAVSYVLAHIEWAHGNVAMALNYLSQTLQMNPQNEQLKMKLNQWREKVAP